MRASGPPARRRATRIAPIVGRAVHSGHVAGSATPPGADRRCSRASPRRWMNVGVRLDPVFRHDRCVRMAATRSALSPRPARASGEGLRSRPCRTHGRPDRSRVDGRGHALHRGRGEHRGAHRRRDQHGIGHPRLPRAERRVDHEARDDEARAHRGLRARIHRCVSGRGGSAWTIPPGSRSRTPATPPSLTSSAAARCSR